MSENSQDSKNDFLRFIKSHIDFVSSNREAAAEYLSSEGLSVDNIIAENIKKIKRLQLQLQSTETKKEMIALNDIKQKAISYVEQLMGTKGFYFPTFIKTENLSFQNRNLESFSEEDIKNTLINYYLLKFIKENKSNE